MSKEQLLHELRVKFIDLNMEYTRRIKSGESINSLQSLNTAISDIVEQIQALEEDRDKND